MGMSESQEQAWVCDHLDNMLAADTQAAQRDYVLEHPVLFSAQALGLIQQARGDEPGVDERLAFLDGSRQYFWENPGEYPLGYGPLERVVAAFRAGEIGFEEALERARKSACADQLSHTYVRAVMRGWVDEIDRDVTFALRAAEIALEAALAMSLPRLAIDVRRAAAEGFLLLAHGGLLRRPDGRAYSRALEIGEWALNDAEAADRMRLKGQYLHELGTLALDAYAGNCGPTPDYEQEVQAWLGRAVDPMPEPVDQLAKARDYLSEAVELRDPGSERGRTLKALLESEVYLSYAKGGVPDRAKTSALADRALADLDPGSDGDHIERAHLLRSL